jgi:EAL domain-containing protein (putative c-di-GMP-specific phosphodiesterase class I)
MLLRLGDGGRTGVAVSLLGLYPLAWGLTIAAGGSQSAMPHAFYLPILLAAVAFGAKAGFLAGLVAAALCGPPVPLDVVTGEPQAMANWLTRGGFFVVVGASIGVAASALRRAYGDAIQTSLERQLALEVTVARSGRPSLEIEAELRALLGLRRFEIVFQPIYSFDTGVLQAAEALARFDTACPEPPDVWFARAAELGLGEPLELAVIEAALERSSSLPAAVALSVNCSPETLVSPGLLALLGRYPDRDIVVEITEHAAIEDYPGLLSAVTALRERGIRLAVDDAGAGFASFRHIVRLAPEIIKLDISLTQNIRQDPVRRALATAIVDFVRETDAELIAEGIETRADLAVWSQLGAHAGQGFLLARPGPLPCPVAAVTIPGRRHPATHDRLEQVPGPGLADAVR